MNLDASKKIIAGGIVLVLLLLGITVWYSCTEAEEYTATLTMESDAMGVVNYYYPRRLVLTDAAPESGLVLPDFKYGKPRFSSLLLGSATDSVFAVVLDEAPNGQESRLYVDKNNNEDLTDDDDGSWLATKGTFSMKEVLLEAGYRSGDSVPYPVVFYRYHTKLPGSLMAYRNGYRKGRIALNDTTYKVALFDDDCDGLFDLDESALVIDINQDGSLDGQTDSGEYFPTLSPFALDDRFYRVSDISPSGERITLVATDSLTADAPGSHRREAAPAFKAQTLGGNFIESEQLRDKVVLIDFWATWCKPWEEERERLKGLYNRFNRRGLEIVGMNLDYDLAHLKQYIREHAITWPQIADGTGWDMEYVRVFNIDAVPRNFLLDSSGMVRFKNLHGKNLEAKVYDLLMEIGSEE